MNSKSKSKTKTNEGSKNVGRILSLQPSRSGSITHTVDLANLEKVDLSKAKPKQVNLNVEYWSPEEGDSKLLIFSHMEYGAMIPDFNDPNNLIPKDTAYFFEQVSEGFQIIRCAATRLVSSAAHMVQGEVYQITFLGMKKNVKNSNFSRFFAIHPVELDQAA